MEQRQSVAVREPAQIEAALQVGLPVIVQKEVGQDRTWARVVGWLPEGAVILDGPAQWVSVGQLFAQNRLVVRFISLGSFYGFSAKVLLVLKSPLLVVLEWPRHMDKVPLSSETRCQVKVAARLAPRLPEGGWGQAGEATLMDLSRGGCQAKVRRAGLDMADFQAGRLVRLSVEVPNTAKPLEVLVQVRNSQLSASEAVLGFSFEPGQHKVLERLRLILAPVLLIDDQAAPAPPQAAAPAPALAAPVAAPAAPARGGPEERPLPPLYGPRVFEVPEEERVDTTANRLPLDQMTAERAAAILGVRALGGSLSAVIRARELVRAWVERYGETAARERRRLLLRDCAGIQGLKLLK